MASDGFASMRFADLLSEPVRNGLYKTKEFHGRGTKVVNMGELFAHPRLGDVPMRRIELTEKEMLKSLLQPGDLLFARRSLVADGAGRCTLVTEVSEPTVFESSIIRARPNQKVTDSRYLYYFFSSPQGRELMRGILRQVAVAGITGGDLSELRVPLWKLSVQQGIAETLSVIDDRIDNLRQTNATLEAIAQALFKSWFIDFDPVRAKAEGRGPEGMDPATAALFPSKFADSELGQIPMGWHVTTLGGETSVIDCLHAKKPELLNSGRPYLQLNCIRGDGLLDVRSSAYISGSDYAKWTSRIEARPGDCVITNVGRVGAVAQMPAGFKAAIGRNMTAIRPNADFPPTFLIELLMSDSMRREIEYRTDAGTILSALNVKSIPKLRFVKPSSELLERFESVCRPIRAAMADNLTRAASLDDLRDTLLPRLISGKLRLPEAGALVDQVA